MGKKKKRRKAELLHEFLAIRVDSYDADISAAINYNLYAPETAFHLDEDDPLHKFATRLMITGTGAYPQDRAGHTFTFTICGDDAPSRGLNLTLKDMQEREEYGIPKYRTYRGRQIPVFKNVKGITFLDKVRGENAWTAWLTIAPRLVTDMLILLQAERIKYVAVHEVREGRDRWIRDIGLQTTDPAAE